MNRTELIEAVQKKMGVETKVEAERAVTAVLDSIKAGVKKAPNTVQIVGFGTFKLKKRPARKGINPKTGEKISIKASKSVGFTPGKQFKESL